MRYPRQALRARRYRDILPFVLQSGGGISDKYPRRAVIGGIFKRNGICGGNAFPFNQGITALKEKLAAIGTCQP